jgi:uncharacterized membrane protein YbjE (DUF340 family)
MRAKKFAEVPFAPEIVTVIFPPADTAPDVIVAEPGPVVMDCTLPVTVMAVGTSYATMYALFVGATIRTEMKS